MDNATLNKCPICKGTGQVKVTKNNIMNTCATCNGKGKAAQCVTMWHPGVSDEILRLQLQMESLENFRELSKWQE